MTGSAFLNRMMTWGETAKLALVWSIWQAYDGRA